MTSEAPETSRLKTRTDFLRAAKGRKAHGALMTLQAYDRQDVDAVARVGFTVTKKVGGAVERNRIKRRLREMVRVTPHLGMKTSHDYVMIARRDVLGAAFPSLAASFRAALRKVHGSKAEARSGVKASAALSQRCDV